MSDAPKAGSRFVAISHDVIDDGTAARAGANGFFLWIVLARLSGGRGGQCTVGIRRLAKLTGFHHDKLCRARESAMMAGLIDFEVKEKRRTTYTVRQLRVDTSESTTVRKTGTVSGRSQDANCSGNQSRSVRKTGTVSGDPGNANCSENRNTTVRKTGTDLFGKPEHVEERRKKNSISRANRKSKCTPMVTRFCDFWEAYPRRVGKRAAEKAYAAAVTDIVQADGSSTNEAETLLIERARLYARERDGEESRYTAHPSSWLNAERYRDEVDVPKTEAEIQADLSRQVLAFRDQQQAAVKVHA